MLTHVTINNFRGLRSLSVPLRPLTVLIGLNDSGKSSFLTALKYLANPAPSFPPSDYWRHDRSNSIIIRGDSPEGHGGIEPPILIPLPSVQPCSFFQLPVGGVATISNGSNDDQGPPILGEDGSMLPSLLDYFLRRDRGRFFGTVSALKNLIPGLQDLEIATPQPERRRLDLLVEHNLLIPAEQASAGVRLLMFFVALAYHPKPPKLILIEEPETGVHPKRLADILKLIRQITCGKYGNHAAQVVITTHSPYLLDHVDLETDQVLVFRREDDGTRTAEPADAERLRAFLDDQFLLGEVWFNQGEEGLVAKRL